MAESEQEMSTKKCKHRNTLLRPATSYDKQDSKGVAGSVRINEEQQVKQLNNQQKIEEPNTPIFCITPKEKFSFIQNCAPLTSTVNCAVQFKIPV